MHNYRNKILACKSTNFEKLVWLELLEIPKGEVRSYKQIANNINKPKSIRAVANAIGKNPFAPNVPCHRVIRSDGTIGGYSGEGGIKTKIELLKAENFDIKKLKI